MSVKIVNITFSKLSNIKLNLLEVNGELEMLSAGYFLQRYDSGSKPNTIKKDAQAIQHFYRFCIKSGINIHRLISSQSPFSMGQIESYSVFCSIDVKTGEQIGHKHYEQRMRISWAFIKWLWLFYQNRTKNELDKLKAAKMQFSAMEAGFNLYLKAPFKTDKIDKQGLSPELRNKFFNIINPLPENDLNPWKSDKIKWRNYALLLTMVLGGNRKGESLLLKLNHFSLSGRRKYFEILKSGDIDYPRSEAPSVKTLGREVELIDIMADVFEHYISVWRKEFSNADKSMYMFLSHRDGLPLSVQTPNAILNELIKKHPEYKEHLSPHRLRNTFHDVLNDALNVQNIGESSLSRKLNKAPIQEYAGGWKRGSEQTHRYPKGSIQREVAQVHQIIQQKILSPTDYANSKRQEEIDEMDAEFDEWANR
jgi:integrase